MSTDQHTLSIGLLELTTQLAKLHPKILLNQLNNDLDSLRLSYNYIWVCNWLFNFRSYLRIQNLFDIDLFELELIGYYPTSDIINKLKTILPKHFKSEKIEDAYNSLKDGGAEIETFDSLSIIEKVDVLYKLLHTISKYSKFRNWAESIGLVEDLRLDPLNSSDGVEYFLLFDNRLYKRSVTFNSMEIPKKRKLTTDLPDYKFEIKEVKFELIFKNIYECEEFMLSIKKSNRPLYNELNRNVDFIIENEIKKRKFLISKNKESQIESLLATRKKSSRIEAREAKRKIEEEQERERLQEEEDLKFTGERRYERRSLRSKPDFEVIQ
ncbi:unnamed protein product [Candida verbasci]|uniref:Uncharacterized protein n=1 Tax=Candida verbasci TaxID=1227364 RepID=A0A9W4TRZ7_9ASCO|nr:unnamed protein product [Candida verbasci]